jgi:hypothetical protein
MDAATFQRAAGNFGVNWTIKFAEAPIDAVSDVYARHLKCEIARQVAWSRGRGAFPPGGVVVQPANGKWTIVFHQWSRFAEFPILAGLKSRLLEFGGSDGNRANTCNLLTPEGAVVRYQVGSVAEEEDEYFELSGRRKAESRKAKIVADYGCVFEQHEIPLVFVYLDQNRQAVVHDEDRAEIVRIDVANLPTLADDA